MTSKTTHCSFDVDIQSIHDKLFAYEISNTLLYLLSNSTAFYDEFCY